MTDPLLLNPTRFGYDAMGRSNLVTDPMNNETSYLYDVRGRLTKVTFPDAKFIAYTYDQAGRRATATDQLNPSHQLRLRFIWSAGDCDRREHPGRCDELRVRRHVEVDHDHRCQE